MLLGLLEFSSGCKVPLPDMSENNAFTLRVIIHEGLKSLKHVRFESGLGGIRKRRWA